MSQHWEPLKINWATFKTIVTFHEFLLIGTYRQNQIMNHCKISPAQRSATALGMGHGHREYVCCLSVSHQSMTTRCSRGSFANCRQLPMGPLPGTSGSPTAVRFHLLTALALVWVTSTVLHCTQTHVAHRLPISFNAVFLANQHNPRPGFFIGSVESGKL